MSPAPSLDGEVAAGVAVGGDASARLATRWVLAGVFVLSAAGMGLELVLTRLLSLTQYHHFAFLAISLGMLGMGAGGVAAYAWPAGDTPAALSRLAWCALGFAASAVPGFVAQQGWSFSAPGAIPALAGIAVKTLAIGLPFGFLGLAMATALRAFASDVARMYGADLVGAALGCILCVYLLEIAGGAGALAGMGMAGGVAAALFFVASCRHRGTRLSVEWRLYTVGIVVAMATAVVAKIDLHPPNRPATAPPLVERWNAHSRVGVYDIANPRRELGETVSPRYQGGFPAARFIQIDSSAGSHILDFAGRDTAALDFLMHDIAFVGFRVHERDGPVLVIGPGGGRDALAALRSGRRRIVGVEVNALIPDLLDREFAEFSGRLWHLPGLELVVDEARSFLARDKAKYAFIHASLACTWAATAGGAFALSENGLYTREAFRSYLDHLEGEGILSMTMWYRGLPGELLRLTALGAQALREAGESAPARHIAVLTHAIDARSAADQERGFGTFLLKRTPFRPAEVARLEDLARELGFRLRFAGGPADDPDFAHLLGEGAQAFIARYPLDISPPSDDRPFFFHQMLPGDYLGAWQGGHATGRDPLHRSVANMLAGLMLVSLVWVAFTIVLPLTGLRRRAPGDGRGFAVPVYFCCIGLGFMLIEIPMLQRLTIFLGKPVYAFSVAMFTLLLCAGIGSMLSKRILRGGAPAIDAVFACIGAALLAWLAFTPSLFAGAMGWGTPARIALTVAWLAPLAVLLGLPLPLMVARLQRDTSGMIELGWAVNAGSAVAAAVFAAAISINVGLSATLSGGLVAYLAAWCAQRLADGRAGT